MLLFSDEWLRAKIAADPDLDCEAGALHPEAPTPALRSEIERLIDQEWQELCEKADRNSPPEYPDMVLIDHRELSEAMAEAYLLALKHERSR